MNVLSNILTLLAMWTLLTATISSAAGLPPNVQHALDQATIAEDNMITGPPGCTETLFNYMKQNWNAVLADINTIAPTDIQKKLIMRACGALDAEDYLNYLEKVRDLRLSAKIDSDVFEDALANETDLKSGFLDENYQNPKAREFLQSLRGLIPAKDIEYVLSGKGKMEYEQVLEADGVQPDRRMLLPRAISNGSRTMASPEIQLPVGEAPSSSPRAALASSGTGVELPRSARPVFYYSVTAVMVVIAIAFIVIWKNKAP